MDTEYGNEAKEEGALLLRLPVEVYRRVVDLVAYADQLSLSRNNKLLRKITKDAITCAGTYLSVMHRPSGLPPV